MIRQDIQELKRGPRELRNFGVLVGIVFSLLGIFFWIRGKPYYPYCLIPGFGLVLAGVIVPKILKPVYLAWMSLAIVLGFIVSHVILTLLFILVITPLGWVSRLAGKDFLRLKLDRQCETYWIPRKASKSVQDYEQQF